MDHVQVQLLYCDYGYNIERIAKVLTLQESYIEEIIKENGWNNKTTTSTMVNYDESDSMVPQSIDADDMEESQSKVIETLRNQELVKQSTLSPLAAVTEVTLLTKICEATRNVDTSEENAHIALGSLAKSYKLLTQDSIASTMAESTKEDTGGININVQTYNG